MEKQSSLFDNLSEERKYLFDDAVQIYDRRRPRYVPELFDAIVRYAGITPDSRLVEVGCGTGQATEPFLKIGCSVEAVELGKNMVEYMREKYREFPNLKVCNRSFEEYSAEENSVDLLYSATAFHWIPPEIGYPKVLRLLKPGGTLALFWNKPSRRNGGALQGKIRALYQEYFPKPRVAESEGTERYEKIRREIESYGFTGLSFQLFHHTREMTGKEYVELLDTYSDHRALEESLKQTFYRAVQTAIEEAGDRISMDDTMDLYLAGKPGKR